jgi:hypothetical protein
MSGAMRNAIVKKGVILMESPSRVRSRAIDKALRHEGHSAASSVAISRQARRSARNSHVNSAQRNHREVQTFCELQKAGTEFMANCNKLLFY